MRHASSAITSEDHDEEEKIDQEERLRLHLRRAILTARQESSAFI